MEAFYAIMIIASGNNSDPITGEAYNFFNEAKGQHAYNKNASQAVCKSFGSNFALPVLTDQSRYTTLIEMAKNGSCAPTLFPLRFYIGLHRNSSGTWVWDDGQIYDRQSSFTNWDENDEEHNEPEPDGISRVWASDFDGYFAMVTLDAKGKTTWMDVRETVIANSVLCQTTDYATYRKLMDRESADHPCSAWNDGKEIKAGKADSEEGTGWSAMKLAAVVIPSTAAAAAAIGIGAAVIKKAMKPPPSPPDISPQDAKDAVDNAKDMMDDVTDLAKTILDRVIILRTLESLAIDDGSSRSNTNQWMIGDESKPHQKLPVQPKKIQNHRQAEKQPPIGICSASDLIATFKATDDDNGEKPMRVECNLSILSQWISEGDRAEINAYERAVRKALPLKIKAILIRGVIKSAKAPGSD